MSVAKKVKGLLSVNNKDMAGLADALGISKQALANKFYRDSFTPSDLIIVADYVGASLAFLSADGSTVVFSQDDLKQY